MRLTLILFLSYFIFVNGLQAEDKNIYKNTNEQGVTEFSDLPGKNSKEINVPAMNTYKETIPTTKKFKEPDKPTDIAYSLLSITSPINDAQVRANDGKITISINSTPSLKPGHSVKITIDGKPDLTLTGTSSSLTFNNISRGTHTAEASIVNSEGKVLIKSPSIKFHLLRFLFKPPAPKPKAPPPS